MAADKTIPLIPGKWLLGSLPELKQDFLGFMQKVFRDYGGVVKFRVIGKSIYLISDPKLVEPVMIKNKGVFVKPYEQGRPRGLAMVLGNGLVTSKGPLWQRQRRMMQPMFHRGHIATMAGEVVRQGQGLVQELLARAGQTLDMTEHMSDVTLKIISRTMFSSDAGVLQHRLADDMEFLMRFSQANFFNPLPLPLWVPTSQNRRYNTSMGFITRAIEEMIAKRRDSGHSEGDLLDVLLQARDEETGEAMSTRQVVDECITMFGAGHETTATALTWALYLISIHPEVGRRLVAEVDSVLQGRTPGMEDLEQLPYTRAVLDETMRLYPSIVSLLRRVDRDFEVDGYHFDKGAISLVNIYNLHHHPDYWEEPETFRPERFLEGNKASIQRHSYIPFGIGERVCIGNHFAMMEAMLLLSLLMQHMSFNYVGQAAAVPQLAISLRPQGGMPLQVQPRESSSELPQARMHQG